MFIKQLPKPRLVTVSVSDPPSFTSASPAALCMNESVSFIFLSPLRQLSRECKTKSDRSENGFNCSFCFKYLQSRGFEMYQWQNTRSICHFTCNQGEQTLHISPSCANTERAVVSSSAESSAAALTKRLEFSDYNASVNSSRGHAACSHNTRKTWQDRVY